MDPAQWRRCCFSCSPHMITPHPTLIEVRARLRCSINAHGHLRPTWFHKSWTQTNCFRCAPSTLTDTSGRHDFPAEPTHSNGSDGVRAIPKHGKRHQSGHTNHPPSGHPTSTRLDPERSKRACVSWAGSNIVSQSCWKMVSPIAAESWWLFESIGQSGS